MLALILAVLLTVVPRNTILVKGATPASSDATTPLPEDGKVAAGRYRNAYFGLTYPIPAGWSEQPAGPPPSDGGAYVLTQFALVDAAQRVKANVLVSAQDLFFSPLPAAGAKELVASLRQSAAQRYEIEREPEELPIAGRPFVRFGYGSPLSGLHWRILSTDVRCHALTFTFTGTDLAALDEAERALGGVSFGAYAPACVKDYAQGGHVLAKTDPQLTSRRYNSIPVRILIDAKGRVKHIHLLSAFPEQSQEIIAALRTWRLQPYVVNGKAVPVETGLVFGLPHR